MAILLYIACFSASAGQNFLSDWFLLRTDEKFVLSIHLLEVQHITVYQPLLL